MKIVFGHRTLSRLHEGPLDLYIDSYLELLNEQGFSHESAEEQVRVIVGFSRWLDENGYKTENVSQEKADRFLCRQTSQFFFVSDRGRPYSAQNV